MHLRALGAMPIKRIPVRWPRLLGPCLFHKAVSELKKRARENRNLVGWWFGLQLQVVRPKHKTFADSWQHVSVAKAVTTNTCLPARLTSSNPPPEIVAT